MGLIGLHTDYIDELLAASFELIDSDYRESTRAYFVESVDALDARVKQIRSEPALTKKSADEALGSFDADTPSDPDAVSVENADSAACNAEANNSTASDVRFKVGDRVRYESDNNETLNGCIGTIDGRDTSGFYRINLDSPVHGKYFFYSYGFMLRPVNDNDDDDFIKLDTSAAPAFNIDDIVRIKANGKLHQVVDVASAGVVVSVPCNGGNFTNKNYYSFDDVEFVK